MEFSCCLFFCFFPLCPSRSLWLIPSFCFLSLRDLTSQVRRCSASIAANLAEDCGKDSDGEQGRFVQIAAGSARELEFHLLLAKDLGFLVTPDYEEFGSPADAGLARASPQVFAGKKARSEPVVANR